MRKFECNACSKVRKCIFYSELNEIAGTCPVAAFYGADWREVEETVTACNQLPKLTIEVFDRPDCPEWAKYAAVNADGSVRVFLNNPTHLYKMYWYDPTSYWEQQIIHSGKYEASDWQNSLIERPAKAELPDWVKVDSMGWHKRAGYFKITYVDDVDKKVNIQQIDDKSKGYLSFNTIFNEAKYARPRPFNDKEMEALVGKVLKYEKFTELVLSYNKQDKTISTMYGIAKSAEWLKDYAETADGELCYVLEHKNEKGEWVE